MVVSVESRERCKALCCGLVNAIACSLDQRGRVRSKTLNRQLTHGLLGSLFGLTRSLELGLSVIRVGSGEKYVQALLRHVRTLDQVRESRERKK